MPSSGEGFKHVLFAYCLTTYSEVISETLNFGQDRPLQNRGEPSLASARPKTLEGADQKGIRNASARDKLEASTTNRTAADFAISQGRTGDMRV